MKCIQISNNWLQSEACCILLRQRRFDQLVDWINNAILQCHWMCFNYIQSHWRHWRLSNVIQTHKVPAGVRGPLPFGICGSTKLLAPHSPPDTRSPAEFRHENSCSPFGADLSSSQRLNGVPTAPNRRVITQWGAPLFGANKQRRQTQDDDLWIQAEVLWCLSPTGMLKGPQAPLQPLIKMLDPHVLWRGVRCFRLNTHGSV